MKPVARLAQVSDLISLLSLFEVSEVSDAAQTDRAEKIWLKTLANESVSIFVSASGDAIVATCMLIVAPNLLRRGRQHGFIENVVTHPEFRGRGYGSCVVTAALEDAWRQDCHHVLLQSGRSDPRVHRFYQSAGFKPGLRTAYVADRPD